MTIPYINKLPVKEVFKKTISSRDTSSIDLEAENAFFVADLGEIYRQHMRWKKLLPRIEPFYAVKCNPDPLVLKLLSALNTGFDCASKSEIQTILSLGVDPSRIIYANPCKQASFIKFACEHKVKMTTFDNVEELYKIKNFFPDAQLVLRILTDDSKSVCKLGLKFGASLDSVGLLLQTAKELDLNVIGVSFHVGSGCYDEKAFVDAVNRAKFVFDKALDYGFEFTLLDVGGGFSHLHQNGNDADYNDDCDYKNIKSINDNRITFERIANALSSAIDKQFPAETNVRIIAEPGRYYVTAAFTIATHVIARRTVGEGKIVDEESDHNVNINSNNNHNVNSNGNHVVDVNNNYNNNHNINGNNNNNNNHNHNNVNGVDDKKGDNNNNHNNVNGVDDKSGDNNNHNNVNGIADKNDDNNNNHNVNGNSEHNDDGNKGEEHKQNDKNEKRKNQSTDNVSNNSLLTVGDLPAKYMYYISDGVYGAFNCIMFDHQEVKPKVLTKDGIFVFGEMFDEEPLFKCSIWGPTCDSIDCVTRNGVLPKLRPGDWLYFEDMGAYTICAASKFNGFKKSTIEYTTTDTRVFDILFRREEEEWKVDKVDKIKDKKRSNERISDREKKRLKS